MASVATSDAVLAKHPGLSAAIVRALNKTHAVLKADVSLATKIGRKLFPPDEAELIADIVRRDLPYYTSGISREFVAGMNRFARDLGLLTGEAAYEQVVFRI